MFFVASYVPFAKTREERDAAKDLRPSLADRYKDRNDYVNHIRITARELTSAGLLLHQDAAIIVNAAAEVRSFK
jgi:Alpha/beta hydrolase domain